MDGCAAYLDGNNGVEGAYGGLEGLEVAILVWEDTEMTCVDTDTDTSVDVLLRRLEPGISLRLGWGVSGG